jgi:hypothetical protein
MGLCGEDGRICLDSYVADLIAALCQLDEPMTEFQNQVTPMNQLQRLIREELVPGESVFREPYWETVNGYEMMSLGSVPNVTLNGSATEAGIRLLIRDLVDVLGNTSGGYGYWDEDDAISWSEDGRCDRLWRIDAEGRTIPAGGGDSLLDVHFIADLADTPQLYLDITNWPLFLEIVRRHKAG